MAVFDLSKSSGLALPGSCSHSSQSFVVCTEVVSVSLLFNRSWRTGCGTGIHFHRPTPRQRLSHEFFHIHFPRVWMLRDQVVLIWLRELWFIAFVINHVCGSKACRWRPSFPNFDGTPTARFAHHARFGIVTVYVQHRASTIWNIRYNKSQR